METKSLYIYKLYFYQKLKRSIKYTIQIKYFTLKFLK